MTNVRKKLLIIIGSILVVIILLLLLLPTILKAFGYHPDYEQEVFDLEGTKALLIATSHDELGEGGADTGVFSSELMIPYYEFLDAGMTVDIASIEGGEIPFEPISLKYPLKSHADDRYLKDDEALEKTANSLKIDDIDFTQYDIIYLAGGWGAAYDLGTSEILGQKITEANAEDKILGSVCHGALGFLMAYETDGNPLVEGKNMTAVTDKQVEELNITQTPQHPETELRALGANFQSNTGFRDFFETLVVVDANIITGQNQNSSGETAQEMLKILAEKIK